jgi:predicted permease
MHQFAQDLRYAGRMLRKNAGLTAVIVLSLAIGIGANTAVFSVVNALLLRPLPYPQPDRLAALWLRSPGVNIPQDWPSPGQYIDLLTQNHSFEEMSISRGNLVTLVGPDRPENVEVLATSSTLFHLFGATPLIGRLPRRDEDVPGKPAVAVLSYAAWQRLFRSDPNIVGQSLTLRGVACQQCAGENKNQFVVAGVLRPDFLLNGEVMQTVANTRKIDIFLPLPLGADAASRRGDENYNLMARLRPGVTMVQAQADVSVIASRIREKDHRDRTFTISVVPLLDQVVGNVRRAVLVLLASVALVLLIACANVANLLLSRATSRQKEIAVRTALGANWRRLLRQLFAESILLALAGGAAGLLIAYICLYVVRTINPGNIPRLEAIELDAGVLAFTFGISLVTGVLFGLAPAVRAVKLDLNSSLKSGGRNTQGDGGFRTSRHLLRSLLVVSQLAFSLILLVGAGLLIHSFIRLQAVSPGFRPDHVISMRVGIAGQPNPNRGPAYWRQMYLNIEAIPGVTAAGAADVLPFTDSIGWGGINVEGFHPQPGQELQVDMLGATIDYFRAMQIPLRQGRFFTEEDIEAKPMRSAIVDEKFALRFWPNETAVGKQVWFEPDKKITIVGVAGTVKQYGLDTDGKIAVYFPSAFSRYLVARTVGDPGAAAHAVVDAIRAADSSRPVYDIRTMDGRMYESLARQRFAAIMLGAFAAFALILGAVGVYGVISYLVQQSTHDLGVRITLGAQRSDILRLVVTHGFKLAGLGIVVGMTGALALTRLMSSMLFGVGATDAVTFGAVPLLLAAAAALASYLPALRATRVDPMTALREE